MPLFRRRLYARKNGAGSHSAERINQQREPESEWAHFEVIRPPFTPLPMRAGVPWLRPGRVSLPVAHPVAQSIDRREIQR